MLQPSLNWAQTNASYALETRIDESVLSSLIPSPSVESFDLSPDGKTVALLVATSFKAQAPLWLVTEELATKRFTAPRQIGHLTILNSNFSPQIRYTSDQQYLVVQDFQTIRVFDNKGFEPVRTISSPSSGASLLPLFITGASNKEVFVCAFGSEQSLNPRFHTTAVRVEVVDVSSGAVLGEWASEDVPQAISPTGESGRRLFATGATRTVAAGCCRYPRQEGGRTDGRILVQRCRSVESCRESHRGFLGCSRVATRRQMKTWIKPGITLATVCNL